MALRQIRQRCHEYGLCFAHDANRKCTILSETYPVGQCKFKKPIKTVTGGKNYPYDEAYKDNHPG